MKRFLKSGLSIFLAITIIFSSAYVGLSEIDFSGIKFTNPFAVKTKAATFGTTGDCTWSLDGTVLTISGNGPMGNYNYMSNLPWGTSITKVVIENGVTAIGSYAFSDCTKLKSVTIGEDVASIGFCAFDGCTYLTSITIPDGVTSIGSSAFCDCTYLKSITIPDGVTSIANWTFNGCSYLESIEIPDSVTSIGEAAFKDCTKLNSVTIGKSVTSIGDAAFSGCKYLTKIYWNAKKVESFSTSSEVFYNAGKSAGGITFVFGNTVEYIPSYLCWVSDTSYSPKVISVTCGSSVTSIGNSAFEYCTNLKSVSISDSVTSIGNYAFYGCTKLSTIIFPKNAPNLGKNVFLNTAYYNDSNNWHLGVLYIGNHILKAQTTLSGSYSIKSGTKTIYPNAFENCTLLTAITFPSTVTNIGDYAFRGCTGLKSITIPSSTTNIGESAFSGCTSLSSISLPNKHIEIGLNAFLDTAYVGDILNNSNGLIYCGNHLIAASSKGVVIKDDAGNSYTVGALSGSCEIKNGTIDIADGVFKNMSVLKSVVIPQSITHIGYNAFYNCTKLTSVYITDIASWCSIEFGGYTSQPLYYANKLYINGILPTSIVIPSSITAVPPAAFSCTNLTSITIPNSVTSIGDFAFYGCTNLNSMTIPNSVTSMGMSVFEGCTKLSSITIPDSVTIIPSSCFENCLSLTTIQIPGNVKSIHSFAFYGCTSLTSITIPASVTSIGGCVFKNCTNLKSVTIGVGVTTIGTEAFNNCTNLEKVNWNAKCVSDFTEYTLFGTSTDTYNASDVFCNAGTSGAGIELVFGDSVERIPAYLLCVRKAENIPKIISVKIGDNVTNIGERAFNYGASIKIVEFGDNVKSIGSYAFYRCFNLSSITIPDSVTSIGSSAFKECGLSSVEIGKGVTHISEYAFKDCSSLAKVKIGEGVARIGESAFYDCIRLTAVYINDIAAWCCIDFVDVESNPLYYAKNLYINGELSKNIVIPDGVTSIGAGAFCDCTSLTSITIPDSVTSIGGSAFHNCTKLTSVYITDMAKWCGIDFTNYKSNPLYYAKNFYINGELPTEIVVPEEVKEIPMYAFSCYNLTSIIIPDSVESVDSSAFSDSVSIYYSGTKSNWAAICGSTLDDGVTVHYNTSTAHDKVVVLKEPTCTDVGIKTVSCNCGYSKNVAIPAKGHSYTDGIVTTVPTCILTGLKKKTCTVCGNTTTETIAALGHNYSTSWTIDKNVTCTASGSKSRHCTRCEAKTDVTTISATGHNYGYWYLESVATCTTQSYKYRTCASCDATEFDIEAPLGHNYSTSWSVDKNATCIAAGSKSRHCTRCDAKTDVTSIAALGHSYGEWTITKDSTCTGKGSKEKTCSKCGNVITETITAIGHKYSTEWTIDIAPTCTEEGSKSRHCTVCGVETDITDIPSLGHSYGDWVVTKAPTSTEEGEKSQTCATCGDVKTQTIPAATHSYSTEWTIDVAPTCTEDGTKSHHCTVCGDKADITSIPSLGHSYGDWVVTKAPTSTAEGEKSQTCATCGDIITQTIPATTHSYSTEWTIDVAPTCTEEGSKSHHCTVCGDKTDITVVEALGHNLESNIIQEPTCTDSGLRLISCTNCDYEIEEAIPATGHTEGEWITDIEPTVYKEGAKHQNCAVCGRVFKSGTIPQLKCSKPSLKTVSNTTSGVKITWGKVKGGNSYNVYRKTKSGSYRQIGITENTYFTDKNAISGKRYYYIVKAVNEAGSSSASSSKSILHIAAPKLTKISNATGGLKITWSKVNGADGYYIYRKLYGTDSWTRVATIKRGSTVSYKDTKVSKGKVYVYSVKAYNGSVKSAMNSTGIRLRYLAVPALKSIANTGYGVKIAWGKITGADGYYIYRKTGSGDWIKIATLEGGSIVSYTDKTAKSGTKYYYAIRAKKGETVSLLSSAKSKYYLADPTLKTPSSTKSGVKLTWTKVTGAEGYIIYRKTGSGSYTKLKTEKGVSNLSYTDSSAKKGKTYTYKVKAYKGKTYSAYSNAKNIKDRY